MTTFPAWLTLCPIGPRCTRCGAVWDRTLAAEADAELGSLYGPCVRADAVLAGLVAFAEYHAACAVEEVQAETVAVVPPGVVPLPADPVPVCPRCGWRYANPRYRRCPNCTPSVGPKGRSWRTISRGANGKASA